VDEAFGFQEKPLFLLKSGRFCSGAASHLFWSGVKGGWMMALVAWTVTASQWTIGQLAMIYLLTFVVGIWPLCPLCCWQPRGRVRCHRWHAPSLRFLSTDLSGHMGQHFAAAYLSSAGLTHRQGKEL
jgi:hypothetical protein